MFKPLLLAVAVYMVYIKFCISLHQRLSSIPNIQAVFDICRMGADLDCSSSSAGASFDKQKPSLVAAVLPPFGQFLFLYSCFGLQRLKEEKTNIDTLHNSVSSSKYSSQPHMHVPTEAGPEQVTSSQTTTGALAQVLKKIPTESPTTKIVIVELDDGPSTYKRGPISVYAQPIRDFFSGTPQTYIICSNVQQTEKVEFIIADPTIDIYRERKIARNDPGMRGEIKQHSCDCVNALLPGGCLGYLCSERELSKIQNFMKKKSLKGIESHYVGSFFGESGKDAMPYHTHIVTGWL